MHTIRHNLRILLNINKPLATCIDYTKCQFCCIPFRLQCEAAYFSHVDNFIINLLNLWEKEFYKKENLLFKLSYSCRMMQTATETVQYIVCVFSFFRCSIFYDILWLFFVQPIKFFWKIFYSFL